MTSRFDDPLRYWKPKESRQDDLEEKAFPKHWLSAGNALPKSHFLVLVQSALTQVDTQVIDDDLDALNEFLAWLKVNQDACLKRATDWYGFKPDWRLIHQLRGLIHGALSALHFKRWESTKGDDNESARQLGEFGRHAVASIQAYQAALGITPVSTSRDESEPPTARLSRAISPVWDRKTNPYSDALAEQADSDGTRPRETNDPLRKFAGCLPAEPVEPTILTTSGVLMWRRLVSFLLGPAHQALVPDERDDGTYRLPLVFQTQGRVLWVSKDKDGNDVAVPPSPFVVQLRQEGQREYYWDPVALGMTLLDDPMIRSAQHAWNLLEQESDWTQARSTQSAGLEPVTPAQTLCIVPFKPSNMDNAGVLAGASAGALVGCAMYATAHRWPLNQDATISATVLDNAGGTGRVSGVLSKLEGAANADPKVRTVVLADVRSDPKNPQGGSGYDDGERRKYGEQARKHGIDLVFERTIRNAIPHLLGDHHCEETLRQFAAWQVAQWERAVTHPDDDRLDHYIIPRYSVFWPRRAVPPALSGVLRKSPTIHSDERRHDRQRPRYRLIMEDVPPEQSLQQPDGRALPDLLANCPWLVLAEDAGAGKSVFTRRAVCWYSSPAAWKVLSRGRPLLALRWANEDVESWRSLFSGTPDATRSFDQAIAARLRVWAEAIQGHSALTPQRVDELNRAATYARTQGRICLVLDAMDQTTDVRVLDEFMAFVNKSAPPSKIAAQDTLDPRFLFRIRLVLTSRLYKLADPKYAKTFTDGRWRFAKVELFDAQRRRLYLADLPEQLRQALVSDEELFADDEDADHDAETYGSPETLKMLREEIEGCLREVQDELTDQDRRRSKGKQSIRKRRPQPENPES